MPRARARSMAFWTMSRFGLEIGKDVDRRIGDQQRLGIVRHVQREDMAHPPFGPQAGVACPRRAPAVHRCAVCLSSASAPVPRAPSPRPVRRRHGCAARRQSRCPTDRAPTSAAAASILAFGPTRIGTIMPRLLASSAPSSDSASQGCTTAVAIGASGAVARDQLVKPGAARVQMNLGQGDTGAAHLVGRRDDHAPDPR